MAALYPTEYPFNVDNEGWPEKSYDPTYPHEYYYDNGQNPPENNNNYYESEQPNTDFVLPLVIRRHTPGSTDPTLQQLSPRNYSKPSNIPFKSQRNQSQSNHHSTSNRNYSPVSNRNYSSVSNRNSSPASLDPDDRPIRPMRDTSVYIKPSIKKKTIPSRKSLPPPPAAPKSRQSSPRYEYDSFQPSPIPPSRNQTSSIIQRRPVRTDLIPKTPFGIVPQRQRPRQVIVEEYVDNYDDNEEYYPVKYIKQVPKKVVSYQPVSGMTTRELENYYMSKPRRVVRVRSPPVETIIYRS